MKNLSTYFVASLWLFSILNQSNHADAFYIPGVHPHSFEEGDKIKLKVDSMTSIKTQMPLDYYHHPFCKPEGGPVKENENFGELLAGEKIQNSPYLLLMKKDMYCEQLCIADLGNEELSKEEKKKLKKQNKHKKVVDNKMVSAIHEGYHNNFIVDNLPSASKVENDEYEVTRYYEGFPIGFVHDVTKEAYINNHVNIEIQYHQDEMEADKYRVVGLIVEPLSIKHDLDKDKQRLKKENNDSAAYLPQVAIIKNKLRSCATTNSVKKHTTYDMVVGRDREPQPASGEVLFTYDVIWTENEDLHWASRWDMYLNSAGSPSIHWGNIFSSLIVVAVLAAMIALILLRNLRRDLARYNRVATSDEEKAEKLEEFGWKLVHGDVFRPPSFSPMALAVMCGTGAQLACMSVCTILISALGFLNPSQRGYLVMGELLIYVFFGSVAGYVTARLYKTFKGKDWQRATMAAAFGFPGITFAFFFLLNLLAWFEDSTDRVPFTTMLILLVLWFGISTPLVFVGAYFGYRADAIEFPVNTTKTPAEIPEQGWFMSPLFTIVIAGILPFGSSFVELFCVLDSIWKELYYYVFGFLLLVFFIFIITSSEITVLLCYLQLCNEDYRWWWTSFCNAGSSAIYVFLYSVVYFKELEANEPITYVLYFGYMSLISLGLFMILGSMGVFSSLYFNKMIFASIKID